MASLTLLFGPSPIPTAVGPHRKVTVTSSAGVTTLGITDPEVEHTNLGADWIEVPRAGDLPFLHKRGPRLRKWRIRAVMYRPAPADVADELDALAFGHALADSVTVAYGRLETAQAVITDLRITTKQRVEGSNEPRHADVELELTAKPPGLRQLMPVPAPSAAPPPPATAAPAASPGAPAGRWHTVTRGETLWAIAQRYYGHGDHWPTIATANGLRDPNRISAGQRLRIP